MSNERKILIVDDEQDILEFAGYNLRKEGFTVYEAKNGREALELAARVSPHIILLDIMMPEMDGIETCIKMREIPALKQVVIAFLTARSEDYSQIAGFQAGADDFIFKPIKPRLLVTRLNALLRRTEIKPASETISLPQTQFGDLSIDYENYSFTENEKEVVLPKKEFLLLRLLTSKPSKVFTRREIFEYIWGSGVYVGDRTIDVYIHHLREKLGHNYIKTVKGVGYRFI